MIPADPKLWWRCCFPATAAIMVSLAAPVACQPQRFSKPLAPPPLNSNSLSSGATEGVSSPSEPTQGELPATHSDSSATRSNPSAKLECSNGSVSASYRGQASYYSDKLIGNSTASGEPYDPRRMTAAHRKLAFGTRVRVTRLPDGPSVIVIVNDRGPFGSRKRIVDLSKAAAVKLKMLRAGVVPVKVEVLDCGAK